MLQFRNTAMWNPPVILWFDYVFGFDFHLCDRWRSYDVIYFSRWRP